MYVFNSGTNKKICMTQATLTGYCIREDNSYGVYYDTFYCNETPQALNIVPLIHEFMSDQSHDVVDLIKLASTPTTVSFSLHFSYDTGTGKVTASLYSGNIQLYYIGDWLYYDLPESIPIYFLWAKSPEEDGCYILPVVTKHYCITCYVEERVGSQGNFILMGNSSEPVLYPMDFFDAYNYEPPYPYRRDTYPGNSNIIYDTPTTFIKQRNDTSFYEVWSFKSSVDNPGDIYISIDGTEPSEEDDPTPPEDDPFTPSAPTPYTPNKDDTSDTITLPNDPPLGITSAGFINVYNPGLNALQGLGDILFPNVASATDIVDAVVKLCETIANQNLINYVIDCHIIPVAPTVAANQSIKVGFRDTGISVPKVSKDYVNFSCGSLSIAEYYGGFADYSATRSKLYIPLVGFVDVLPEFWQAGTISLDYKFNIIDGSFMAYVRSKSSKSQLNGSVIAQYGGNACVHLPLTGVNYANMVSGLIQAAAGIVTGGAAASAVVGGATSALNTIAKGGDVQQSNGYNSTTAILGVRTPYLQIERLKPAWSTKYRHDKGLPSNIATSLNNISGFTVIEDIDLTGLPFTQGEVEELRGLLKDGVYF